MNPNNNILQELIEISPVVANLSKNNVYTTPPNYFTNLENEILLKLNPIGLLSSSKANTYDTPNGYFTNLAENIVNKVKQANYTKNEVAEELQIVAPFLNTISKENVYTVNNQYFNNLSFAPLKQEKAKIISFSSTRKWLSYAAAAVIMSILATGVVQYLKTDSNTNFHIEIQKTSDEELNSYLDNQPNTDATATSYHETNEIDASGLFEGTPTEELHNYLNEQPETTINSKDNI